MNKFKYPVSMVVTKEQFEADLRKPLEDLGYEIWVYGNFTEYPHITTWGTVVQNVNMAVGKTQLEGCYKIDHYNPELFIALSACIEGDEPHVGEWFVNRTGAWWPLGKMVKVTRTDSFNRFEDGMINDSYDRSMYNKASKEEIIQHFTKNKTMKEGTPKGELIGYKLIKPEYEAAALEIANKGHSATIGKAELYNLLDTPQYNLSLPALRKAGVLDLWFEPVYKEEERFLTVSCDQGQFNVKVVPEGFEFADRVVTLTYINGLVNLMKSQASVGGWSVSLTKVNIGCKTNIPIEDLQKLINEHGK